MRTKKAVKTALLKVRKAAAERFSRTLKTFALDRSIKTSEGILRKIPRNVLREWNERNIGLPDYSDQPPEKDAGVVGKSVARLVTLADGEFEAEGFATGFLIAPGILMTNHHVFETKEQAMGTGAQFLYEYGADGRLRRGIIFRLEPEKFFVADESLDFALVAVEETSETGKSIRDFDPIPIHASALSISKGDTASIIQYPEGGYKKYAYKDNLVVDLFEEGFIHYTTDTMPGSSGSPAFTRTWQLCALHHCGVPEMKGDDIITRNGGIWTDSMSDEDIHWIANEGISLKTIFSKIRQMRSNAPENFREYYERLRTDLESIEPETLNQNVDDSAKTMRLQSENSDYAKPTNSDLGFSHVVINVTVTNSPNANISINANAKEVESTRNLPSTETQERRRSSSFERRIRFDTNYANREGYDRDFLDAPIDLPDIAENRHSEMYREGGRIVVLPYHHFSIAMNQHRRLAMWTAANVNYNDDVRDGRDRDAFGDDYWIEDPRLPSELQLKDADFYAPATLVDRGHLVRRQDNAWGVTASEIEYGNSDTFHWTNCTPQHERFNRSMSGGQWGAFEEHIVQQISGFGRRVSIFSGPVLANNDPGKDYGQGYIQYPVKFWKIIAGVDSGDLIVFAFMFDQGEVIRRFGLEDRFDSGRFSRRQVTVDFVQQVTGVHFPQNLIDADVLAGTTPDDFREVNPTTIRRTPNPKLGQAKYDEIP